MPFVYICPVDTHIMLRIPQVSASGLPVLSLLRIEKASPLPLDSLQPGQEFRVADSGKVELQ